MSPSEGGARSADFRLVPLALGAWAGAAAGLCLHATTDLLIAGVAAVVPVVGWAIGQGAGRSPQRWRPWAAVALALTAGLSLGFSTAGPRVATRDALPVGALAGDTSVEVIAVVTDDPRRITGTGGSTSYLIPVRVKEVHRSGLAPGTTPRPAGSDARIIVLTTEVAWHELLPGQLVSGVGQIERPRGGDLTAAVLRARGTPRLIGAPPWYQRAAGRLRTGLQRACRSLPVEPAGLLPGLAVGDTSRLTPELADAFRAAGLTHLVAVSGSNVAMVLSLVILVGRWCRVRRWVIGVGSAAALLGFVVLVRPSASVLRAAGMGGLAIAALLGGRPRAAVPALAATVVLALGWDPALAVDRGFALSVSATAGLLLIAPGWRAGLLRRGVPLPLAEAVAVAAAAQVACGPLIAAISGTVSLIAVPANLLAAPAVGPATILGVGAAVMATFSPGLAGWVAWLGGWPARWLVVVAHGAASVPLALPWLSGTAGAVLLAGVLIGWVVLGRLLPRIRRVVVVLLCAALVGGVPVRVFAAGWPAGGWRFVACDVGQGDALALWVDDGVAVVVDAGPEPTATDRCLRRLGVRAVPLLVVTHLHADHVGGVAGVLRGRAVERILLPTLPEPAAAWDALLATARAHRVAVAVAAPDVRLQVGTVGLRVLVPARPLRGTRSDPNNNSTVLLVETGGLRLLLAGDAETEEQSALLESADPHDLHADVLKVGHHGSAYQNAEFIAAIQPAVGIVSVGAHNRYGQPDAGLLRRLVGFGMRLFRTDRQGDVAVIRQCGHLSVVLARGGSP